MPNALSPFAGGSYTGEWTDGLWSGRGRLVLPISVNSLTTTPEVRKSLSTLNIPSTTPYHMVVYDGHFHRGKFHGLGHITTYTTRAAEENVEYMRRMHPMRRFEWITNWGNGVPSDNYGTQRCFSNNPLRDGPHITRMILNDSVVLPGGEALTYSDVCRYDWKAYTQKRLEPIINEQHANPADRRVHLERLWAKTLHAPRLQQLLVCERFQDSVSPE
mgnify:CR=1 FL=1